MKEEDLVGRWFVTANPGGLINNQGRILSMVSDAGFYRVVVFSWLFGEPNGEHIVSLDDIAKYFLITGSTFEEHDAFCDNAIIFDRGERCGKRISKPAYQVGKGPL